MANLGKVALAMLGILAYQNRDKLGALLRGNDRSGLNPNSPQQPDGGGLLEQITDTLGAGGGLADLLDRFRQSGSGEQADSWVRQGPNQPVDRQQVEAAIDPETINELSLQTGLSRKELLERIAHDLPDAVDKMTPGGHLPDEAANAKPAKPTLLDPVPPRTQ
jgi:uncharacterized protein YidB (DUF937 family)